MSKASRTVILTSHLWPMAFTTISFTWGMAGFVFSNVATMRRASSKGWHTFLLPCFALSKSAQIRSLLVNQITAWVNHCCPYPHRVSGCIIAAWLLERFKYLVLKDSAALCFPLGSKTSIQLMPQLVALLCKLLRTPSLSFGFN